jgi:hypothetical protein
VISGIPIIKWTRHLHNAGRAPSENLGSIDFIHAFDHPNVGRTNVLRMTSAAKQHVDCFCARLPSDFKEPAIPMAEGLWSMAEPFGLFAVMRITNNLSYCNQTIVIRVRPT